MKKVLILILIIILLVGCEKKEKTIDKEENQSETVFVLEKKDESKELIYLEDFREIHYKEDEIYKLQNLVINIKSDAVDNINLELRSFVQKTYKDIKITDGFMDYGNVISYNYYVTDKYISVIQEYYKYIDGIDGEIQDNVYVFSLDTGKVLSNEDILNKYNLTEDDLFTYLENNLDTDDVKYTVMMIKKHEYKLYVNDKDELVIIYHEMMDEDSIKKELIIKN